MSGDATPPVDTRSRQKRVGDALREDTRARILQAAGIAFAEKGYAATTVAGLAAAAGVSLQTLYHAWGSKRALLRAYMEDVLAGEGDTPEDAATQFSEALSAEERITLLADLVAEVARRASTAWAVYQEAAAVDPEISLDWTDLQTKRHHLFRRIIGRIPEAQLRAGLTTQDAVDTAWVLASPETFALLNHRLHYSPEKYRIWLGQTLTSAVLDERRNETEPRVR